MDVWGEQNQTARFRRRRADRGGVGPRFLQHGRSPHELPAPLTELALLIAPRLAAARPAQADGLYVLAEGPPGHNLRFDFPSLPMPQ